MGWLWKGRMGWLWPVGWLWPGRKETADRMHVDHDVVIAGQTHAMTVGKTMG